VGAERGTAACGRPARPLSNKTLVLKVPKARHAALERCFTGGAFEFRAVPHAAFSVKGDGVVATLYHSGKFVLQGADPEFFLARYTDLPAPEAAPAGAAPPSDDPIVAIDGPMIGSDETGKGDYFGPLVVAAARLEPEMAAELVAAGVADSKKLSDGRAMKLGAFLRERIPHAIRVLAPVDYNQRYGTYKSLNPMLADLHAEVIRELAQPGIRVLVDQFASERLMREALAGTDVRLEQAHRAERNVAVAAASILARQEFLAQLRELSEEFSIDLHKGAGEPVDRAAERFVRLHGFDALGKVAKLHFKNTTKLRTRGH